MADFTPEPSSETLGGLGLPATGFGGKLAETAKILGSGFLTQLLDMVGTPLDVIQNKYDVRDLPEVGRQFATDLALNSLAIPAPTGAFRVFGGPRAKTANLDALREAQGMESHFAVFDPKQGRAIATFPDAETAQLAAHNHGLEWGNVMPEDIWHRTGWFKGPDGQWRFEIPDTDASWQPMATKDVGGNKLNLSMFTPQRLGDMLDHPELFKAYPDLADMKLKSTGFDFNTLGSYEKSTDTMRLRGSDSGEDLSTALHEIQHGIQSREGFARGGNTQEFMPEGLSEKLKFAESELDDSIKAIRAKGANSMIVKDALNWKGPEKMPDYMKRELDLVKDDPELLDKFTEAHNAVQPLRQQVRDVFNQYESLAGEVEARNVQERHAQGVGQETPPWATTGYPTYDQLVRFHDDQVKSPPRHKFEPVEHNPFEPMLSPVDHDPFAETPQ